jgi:hypothetical protein
MKPVLLLVFLLLLLSAPEWAVSQKVILLQKPGTGKRFFYEHGDKLTVKLGVPEFTASGTITAIDDSTCTLDRNYTFQLAAVTDVVRARHFLKANWARWFLVSALYAAGSVVNHAIQGEKLYDNTIPIVSGSAALIGTASWLARYRHCRMEDRWVLKVLDFDVYKKSLEKKEQIQQD